MLFWAVTGCKKQSDAETPKTKLAETETCEEIAIPEEVNEEENSTNETGTLTGLYQFSDSNGTSWIIQINKDESARLWKKDDTKNVFYGSWDNIAAEDGEIWLNLDKLEEMNVKKEDGSPLDMNDAFGYPIICGKWLYLDGDALKAKDPSKRAPIKKVK
mgnify:CR=1 FL=1